MIEQFYSAAMAGTAASKPLIRCQGQAISYGEVDNAVRKLARVFRDRGLVAGDYVLLNLKNDTQLAVIYLACVVNGLAAVITDPSTASLPQLAFRVKPRLGFIDKEKLESLLVPLEFEIIAVEQPARNTKTLFKKLLQKSSPAERPVKGTHTYPALLDATTPIEGEFPNIDPDTTALVLFTSGTTAEPKGVELSQKNIATQLDILLKQLQVTDRSEIFNILPMHHTDGTNSGVTLALAAGATLHRPDRFSISNLPLFLDYIFREGISHLITVPTVLALIERLGDDFEDAFLSGEFRVLVSTADHLPIDLWLSFQDRFKVRVSNAYGSTEVVSMVTFCGPDDNSFRIGSIGKPIANDVHIVNESGKSMPTGEQGELLVRGDLVMKGYINDPRATAEVFTEDWFHTGDIARIAEDGNIEILGRKKNIIVQGGVNIHPAEIADAALDYEGVLDAVAFGVPDAIWGQVAVLCIVECPQSGSNIQALQAFLESSLANEKLPSEIHAFADFPRGPAGKVILRQLQDQVVLRKQSRCFRDEGDTLDVVLRIGAALLKVPPEALSLSSSADNANGWDSLFHLNFILSVEETFALQFLPREIMAVRSLGDLVELAKFHLSSTSTRENDTAPR